MPKVSVIIPNYNHAKYLKQRIESVINQSFQDFEIIILDDCSNDNSKEIINLYREHPKVKTIIFNEYNSGSTFKQWQKGISYANGEWVWIAESDDWCEDVFLANLLAPTYKDNNIVISYCCSLITCDSKIIGFSKFNYLNKIHDSDSYLKLLTNNNLISNASSAIFKKNVFLSISQEFLNFKFCGDWFVWLEIAKCGSIYESGKVLNYFRKHNADITGKAYANGVYYDEYLKILNYQKNKNYINSKEVEKKLLSKYFELNNTINNKKIRSELRYRYVSILGYKKVLFAYFKRYFSTTLKFTNRFNSKTSHLMFSFILLLELFYIYNLF